MPEWSTYTLSDFLMFSPRTYHRLFELYNQAVWPLQIVALALGLIVILLMLRNHGRAVALILAGCWLFVAWAYLLERYDTINWAGRYLAIGFVLQAALLIIAILRDRLVFEPDARTRIIGVALVALAVAIEPMLGALLGRPWTQAEIFGLAPDPTVVATLGVLTAARRAHWLLLLVPLLWCAFSGATLWTMEASDWVMLPTAGAIALACALLKVRQVRAT